VSLLEALTVARVARVVLAALAVTARILVTDQVPVEGPRAAVMAAQTLAVRAIQLTHVTSLETDARSVSAMLSVCLALATKPMCVTQTVLVMSNASSNLVTEILAYATRPLGATAIASAIQNVVTRAVVPAGQTPTAVWEFYS
jgi:hypothetical protein